MHFINLGGVPTSGKTELVRGLLLEIGQGEPFQAFRWICGTIHHDHKLIILGKYFTGRALEGTDALERTCHRRGGPEFVAWALERFPKYKIFCEGERFMKRPFAKAIQQLGVNLEYVFLEIEEAVRQDRQGRRVSSRTQDQDSLNRWNSFYRNWAAEFPPKYLANNIPEEYERNLKALKAMLSVQA